MNSGRTCYTICGLIMPTLLRSKCGTQHVMNISVRSLMVLNEHMLPLEHIFDLGNIALAFFNDILGQETLLRWHIPLPKTNSNLPTVNVFSVLICKESDIPCPVKPFDGYLHWSWSDVITISALLVWKFLRPETKNQRIPTLLLKKTHQHIDECRFWLANIVQNNVFFQSLNRKNAIYTLCISKNTIYTLCMLLLSPAIQAEESLTDTGIGEYVPSIWGGKASTHRLHWLQRIVRIEGYER